VTVGYRLEYIIEPKQAIIQQRQIGVDVPDMLAGIQSALLQHADVIFVTEIRDLEVFQACLRAAEMDCLVLTQLHLPTPESAIERMIALQPDEMRWTVKSSLAEALRGLLCQCLLPTPQGKQVAAYGVLLPDDRARKLILEGGHGLDDLCSPRIEADVQRLRDEGKVVPEAADEALRKLETARQTRCS
jgi:twitching motility protein PilT